VEPFCGMSRKVTSGWPVTHPNGLGARGYVDNAFRVEKRTLDPNTGMVTVEATDVEPMLEPLSAPAGRVSVSASKGGTTRGPHPFGPGGVTIAAD